MTNSLFCQFFWGGGDLALQAGDTRRLCTVISQTVLVVYPVNLAPCITATPRTQGDRVAAGASAI